MKALTTNHSAHSPRLEIPTIRAIRRLKMIAVSLFLGITALFVAFVAASACETPGTTSIREVSVGCIAATLYLMFCQFWLTPRQAIGFTSKLPTFIACLLPLAAIVKWSPWAHGIPLWLVSGLLGSVIGVLLAQQLTKPPKWQIPTVGSGSGKSNESKIRNYLAVGFTLLVAIAFVILIGVVPSVMADTSHGSYAHTNGCFLAITVTFDLLAAMLLGLAVWHSPKHQHPSGSTLGITAFLALYLGLTYCGFGVLFSNYGPALRAASVMLMLCATLSLITTTLMTITSVIVDRAGWPDPNTVNPPPGEP